MGKYGASLDVPTNIKNRYAQCIHASTLRYGVLARRRRISDNDKKTIFKQNIYTLNKTIKNAIIQKQ